MVQNFAAEIGSDHQITRQDQRLIEQEEQQQRQQQVTAKYIFFIRIEKKCMCASEKSTRPADQKHKQTKKQERD